MKFNLKSEVKRKRDDVKSRVAVGDSWPHADFTIRPIQKKNIKNILKNIKKKINKNI